MAANSKNFVILLAPLR